MKKFFFSILAAALVMPVFAEDNEFESEERLESGFLTSYLNKAIENGMASNAEPAKSDEMKYGRTVTQYVSAPKFGGYVIGRYQYSDQDGKKGGPGFNQHHHELHPDRCIDSGR